MSYNNVIQIVNQLQIAMAELESPPLDLPQIVVCGSQSSGKSAVLTKIIGKDFLPQGTGIVTRCPIVLQLSPINPQSNQKEFATFHHNSKVFYDFDEIKEEIKTETERLAPKLSVSQSPIYLSLHLKNIPELTLVDLPGLTNIPTNYQPQEIVDQIREIVFSYLRNENALIVVVTPANQDIANDLAIKAAQQFDSEGKRTLCVLTKLDLMDQETHAMELIEGKILSLKLGFIPVVNRSQKDLNQKISIQKSLENEKNFFETHNQYKQIAYKCGTKYLSEQLSELLINHIKAQIPVLQEQISTRISKTKLEYESLRGDSLTEKSNSKGEQIIRLLHKFCQENTETINGTSTKIETNKLYGGSLINYIFNDIFVRFMSEIDITEGISKHEIINTIRNCAGPRNNFLVPEKAFEILITREILKLETPCLKCIDQVAEELNKIIKSLDLPEFSQYHNLQNQVLQVSSQFIKFLVKKTKKFARNLVQIESAYINTGHPHFQYPTDLITQITAQKRPKDFFLTNETKPKVARKSTDLPPVPSVIRSVGELSESQKKDATLIYQLMKNYFEIVQTKISDSIPKSILHFLVYHFRDNLLPVLHSHIYQPENFDKLLEENQVEVEKRKKCYQKLESLKKAKKIIKQVTDVPGFYSENSFPKVKSKQKHIFSSSKIIKENDEKNQSFEIKDSNDSNLFSFSHVSNENQSRSLFDVNRSNRSKDNTPRRRRSGSFTLSRNRKRSDNLEKIDSLIKFGNW
ncbi:dynamin related protein 1 isoform a [Anaeramoeba ignava]|uniref:Dynamin related protein 1 isoform a n=1 Tax=Anaeramoeba ignava TaxID=1746090 RepID=A0A9Q0LP26_ANAIG|nr:dynamin related protein 1 isoform a [Anaeramoeba ignava]